MNGAVEEEVYVEQPLGFETHDRQTHVCNLKKALHGLKHTERAWYTRMENFLMSQGFTKSKEDSNLYFKVEGRRPVILLLYVDDLFLTSEDELIVDAKGGLSLSSR